MKPVPRSTRSKRFHRLNAEPERSDKLGRKWHREEKKKLVIAMKRLNTRTAGGKTGIDCAFLRKYVLSRSVSEIESLVEFLKKKVMLNARFKLKKKRSEEKNARKPIEEWTHAAASLAGTLEETISTAFSQMLMVSSTEPCTLRNGDPPQVHRSPADGPVGRTIPLRPMPVPVQGDHRYIKTACPVPLLKAPASTAEPAKRPPTSSNVFRVSNITTCLAQQQPPPLAAATFDHQGAYPETVSPNEVLAETGQIQCSSGSPAATVTLGSSDQDLATTSASKCVSSSFQMPVSSSATSLTSVPSSVSSAVASTCSPISGSTPHTLPQSTSATQFHAGFGRTSKYATKDSPRTFGVKCVVDFEKIYSFLSVIQKPSQDCHLTPMESAIVLDLLMSLPEELPLLDCKKLHKHMFQVYQCLSAPGDSKMARQMFKDLKNGLFNSDQGNKSKSNEAESQSSQSYNTSSKLEDSNVTVPPLNPFIVPVTLLKRSK